MMFWADHVGVQRFYKGWKVLMGQKPKDTKIRLATSLQKELEWLREYLSVDTVTFLLPNTDAQDLGVYATIGLEEEIVQKVRIPIGQGIAGRIAANIKPMIVNNLSDVEVVSPVLRQKDIKSLVGIPIPLKQDMVGVLHVGTFQSHQFTERDLQQLQLVGHRISWMIKDAGLLNFEHGYYNQEDCFEVLGLRIRTSCFNTMRQAFMLNILNLRVRVLRLPGLNQCRLAFRQGNTPIFQLFQLV